MKMGELEVRYKMKEHVQLELEKAIEKTLVPFKFILEASGYHLASGERDILFIKKKGRKKLEHKRCGRKT